MVKRVKKEREKKKEVSNETLLVALVALLSVMVVSFGVDILYLGTRFARRARFPMGREPPQGAVTRLCARLTYTFYQREPDHCYNIIPASPISTYQYHSRGAWLRI